MWQAPKYNLLVNNCQDFASKLVEAISMGGNGIPLFTRVALGLASITCGSMGAGIALGAGVAGLAAAGYKAVMHHRRMKREESYWGI